MKTKSNKKGQMSGPVSLLPPDLIGKLNAPALPAWTPERKAAQSKANGGYTAPKIWIFGGWGDGASQTHLRG